MEDRQVGRFIGRRRQTGRKSRRSGHPRASTLTASFPPRSGATATPAACTRPRVGGAPAAAGCSVTSAQLWVILRLASSARRGRRAPPGAGRRGAGPARAGGENHRPGAWRRRGDRCGWAAGFAAVSPRPGTPCAPARSLVVWGGVSSSTICPVSIHVTALQDRAARLRDRDRADRARRYRPELAQERAGAQGVPGRGLTAANPAAAPQRSPRRRHAPGRSVPPLARADPRLSCPPQVERAARRTLDADLDLAESWALVAERPAAAGAPPTLAGYMRAWWRHFAAEDSQLMWMPADHLTCEVFFQFAAADDEPRYVIFQPCSAPGCAPRPPRRANPGCCRWCRPPPDLTRP